MMAPEGVCVSQVSPTCSSCADGDTLLSWTHPRSALDAGSQHRYATDLLSGATAVAYPIFILFSGHYGHQALDAIAVERYLTWETQASPAYSYYVLVPPHFRMTVQYGMIDLTPLVPQSHGNVSRASHGAPHC